MIGGFINLQLTLPCLGHVPYPGIAGIDMELWTRNESIRITGKDDNA